MNTTDNSKAKARRVVYSTAHIDLRINVNESTGGFICSESLGDETVNGHGPSILDAVRDWCDSAESARVDALYEARMLDNEWNDQEATKNA